MISLILKSIRFAILLEADRKQRGEKLTILFIHCKKILNWFCHCIGGSLFKCFSEEDNELVCSQPFMLISPGSIFLRHAITHKVLSSDHLYSNVFRRLPFLECLSTSVGKMFSNKKIRSIFSILNNLIILSLWTPRSSSPKSLCVKTIFDKKQVLLAAQNTRIKYPHPTRNLALALVVSN